MRSGEGARHRHDGRLDEALERADVGHREGDDAIPADQFLRLHADDPHGPLYLAPGRYRLRVRDDEGDVRSERNLVVAGGG